MQESIKHKELAKHRTAAVLKREQDRAAKGNTLDKITEKFKEGPLLLLRRYYKTSVRLQVVTRHASGVRGTATGKPFLLFDRSINQSSNQSIKRPVNQAINQPTSHFTWAYMGTLHRVYYLVYFVTCALECIHDLYACYLCYARNM